MESTDDIEEPIVEPYNPAINQSLLDSDISISTDIEGAYSTEGSHLTYKKRSNYVFYFLVLSPKKYDHTLEGGKLGTPVHKSEPKFKGIRPT